MPGWLKSKCCCCRCCQADDPPLLYVKVDLGVHWTLSRKPNLELMGRILHYLHNQEFQETELKSEHAEIDREHEEIEHYMHQLKLYASTTEEGGK